MIKYYVVKHLTLLKTQNVVNILDFYVSPYNRLSLCVIDIYSKYAWVIPLKDKKGITITNAIQKILDESNDQTNKI